MPLPKGLRTRVPNRIRDNPSLRAIALATGLIPPRPMHTPAEAIVLSQLARNAHRVVEIGVYEGSSAVAFCAALAPSAELHLIDPFVDESGWALRAGWRGSPLATRLTVWRAARAGGPHICWHIARSQDVGRAWASGPVDLVFIDGDHSPSACREDWDLWHPHVRPGGSIAFHDARAGRPGGEGGVGPTAVVDELFRGSQPPDGWQLASELDSLVVVQREPDASASASSADVGAGHVVETGE